jgi:DNA-binding PadR family transcriptional regulator
MKIGGWGSSSRQRLHETENFYQGNRLTETYISVIISENDITKNDTPKYDIPESDIKVGKEMNTEKLKKYLPLTEATYYIMLVLVEPLHGYGVMQKVEQISQGVVKIGPGTLYGAFGSLEKEGLIKMVKEEDRRKCYQLTDKGRQVLVGQIERLEIMNANGSPIRERLVDALERGK